MLKKLTTCLIVFIFLISNFSISNFSHAQEFNPGYIISDNELTDYEDMSLDQVQNFLEKKGSFLAKYVEPRVRMMPAQIIHDMARLHRISSKYLLVLLQKEQSLITDSNPSKDQLDWATGYGICDACSKSDPALQKYRGLANQIDWGAGAMRYYMDHPDEFKHQVGKTSIIDGESVYMINRAACAFYNYTPHLEGNQNFFNIWQDWFALEYPDGSVVQDLETGAIYLIQSAQKRVFSSKAVLYSYYTLDKVIPIEHTDLEKYPIGLPIKFSNYSLIRIPTGGVYLVVDDILRPIQSREALRLLGYNPEEIIDVELSDINDYPRGAPLTEKSIYPVGALLQDKKTGGVYYVKDGVKSPLLSKTIMNLYYKDLSITPVSQEELNQCETGVPVKLKDGELARSVSESAVYVISNGHKRPFVSAEAFEEMGYSWENVIVIEDRILGLHEMGTVITLD